MVPYINMDRSDQQLVADYLKGDEKSLEILIQQYLKPIYNFVYRYAGNAQDAEDITQDVFMKVWRNLKKFDRQKSFKSWIFTIAKNASIDALKKKKPAPFSEFSVIETIADPSPSPNEIFERKEISQMLSLLINKLPLKYREVLFLRYSNGLAFQKIAESLNEPLNTVKSRHRRALITLKKFLKE